MAMFPVRDLTSDQYDVRILPQERFERLVEGHPSPLINLNLVDACEVDLDRVFRRRNIDVGLVQNVDAAIQRHSFTRPGWTCDQNIP